MMNRVAATLLAGMLLLSGCTRKNPETSAPQPQTVKQQPTMGTTGPHVEPGSPRAGEASGSYTAKGETVELKYAYAGRGERFGNEATTILITDKPISPEAVAEEIKSQTLLLDGKIRGLEYVIDEHGYWVRYHPGQYQESKTGQLKELVIEGDVVRGNDEDKGELTNGRYSRSVKFVATMIK
jgi:hypothetical protein